MELFCFCIFVLSRCHMLEMWQIHVSEVSVFQFNTRCSQFWTRKQWYVDIPTFFLLPFLLIKQLVSARNCLYCTVQHMDQTLFLALYSNQPWPFFSHVSKGTTIPKLVSLATVETVELQFVIDQSLALGIFLHSPSFHVACGVWKVVARPSFLSPLRQSQWTTTFCVLITGRNFFSLQFTQNCFDFL